MTYPVLKIRTGKIIRNLEKITEKCRKHSISVWGVTKGLSCPLELASRMADTQIAAIADSRMANLQRLKDAGIQKPLALIRIPMPSELPAVVKYADYSVVSEISTINRMRDICLQERKAHNILLMVDMGDLREGFWPSEIEAVADCVSKLPPLLRVAGIGVNFACASGVIPTQEHLQRFVNFGEELERLCGYRLDSFSGGATTQSLLSLDCSFLPERINNLRIGEGYLLGTDSGSQPKEIPWLEQDTMVIEAEVVEVRRKPSKPIGSTGRDAFGNTPVFADRGTRLRAILALGKQDIHIQGLTPLDAGIEIITASSDHLLVDAEAYPGVISTGQILRFRPDYPAMLAASTSMYVAKQYTDD